jgi:hypothetical protein
MIILRTLTQERQWEVAELVFRRTNNQLQKNAFLSQPVR